MVVIAFFSWRALILLYLATRLTTVSLDLIHFFIYFIFYTQDYMHARVKSREEMG